MPSEFYQAYFSDPPYKKVEEVFTCDHFWPISEDGRLTIDTKDKD